MGGGSCGTLKNSLWQTVSRKGDRIQIFQKIVIQGSGTYLERPRNILWDSRAKKVLGVLGFTWRALAPLIIERAYRFRNKISKSNVRFHVDRALFSRTACQNALILNKWAQRWGPGLSREPSEKKPKTNTTTLERAESSLVGPSKK